MSIKPGKDISSSGCSKCSVSKLATSNQVPPQKHFPVAFSYFAIAETVKCNPS